jgi:hypothetical protein
MSIINFFEIIEPNENYLQDRLYNILKTPWRENKSDAVNDQLKFYETYFIKKDENTQIDKDIIQEYLKESEKIHHNQLQENDPIKDMHVDLDYLGYNRSIVYFFDNKNKNMNIFSFLFNKFENENVNNINIHLSDQLEIPLDFDTKLRQLMVPSSYHFKNNESNIVAMDMYSIYNLSINILKDEININKFQKVKQLSEMPNSYISNTLVDRLFVIQNSIITPNNNILNLFDNEFNVVYSKMYSNDNYLSLDCTKLKGEFFNHPNIIMLFKESGRMCLSDIRVYSLLKLD